MVGIDLLFIKKLMHSIFATTFLVAAFLYDDLLIFTVKCQDNETMNIRLNRLNQKSTKKMLSSSLTVHP